MEQKNASFLKESSLYAVILGFSLIILMMVLYIINYSGGLLAQITELIFFVFGIFYFTRKIKQDHLKNIEHGSPTPVFSFGNIFIIAITIGLLSYLLVAIFSYFYYAYIDIDVLAYKLNSSINMYEKFDFLKEEDLEKMIVGLENSFKPYVYSRGLFFNNSIVTLLCALIAGGVFRSKDNGPIEYAN